MKEQLANALLRAAYDYWDQRRGERAMPARVDLDPADIPKLLPYVILTDVVSAEPLDFRYRLIGTAICQRIARDYTGRRLIDLPHQRPGSLVWDRRADCVRTMAPVYDCELPYIGPSHYVRRVSQIHLPLSPDGTAVIEAAALSFLGLGGGRPETAEWGRMLTYAQAELAIAPWLAFLPGICIMITALGFTLLGEALREAMDPRTRKR